MSRRVVVAEDDAGVAEMVCLVLQDEGYRVALAHDGAAALELVRREPPDLVLADVMMPRVDGLTLTQTLRAEGNRTPVVLMSAVYAEVDLPGVRFLPKPFDIEYLLLVVARVFAEMDGRGATAADPDARA